MDSGNDDPSGDGMRVATTTDINSSLPGASEAEPLKLDSGEGKATTGLQGT